MLGRKWVAKDASQLKVWQRTLQAVPHANRTFIMKKGLNAPLLTSAMTTPRMSCMTEVFWVGRSFPLSLIPLAAKIIAYDRVQLHLGHIRILCGCASFGYTTPRPIKRQAPRTLFRTFALFSITLRCQHLHRSSRSPKN